jgi:hypothetical protein
MQYKAFVCHSRFREWLCQGIFVGSEELLRIPNFFIVVFFFLVFVLLFYYNYGRNLCINYDHFIQHNRGEK